MPREPAAIPPPATLIIAGPTAVGKSQLGLAVALRAPGEIIVADSMQVYRGFDVGTGKPTPEERRAVPHHLVDACEPGETFSAFEFARRAAALVGEIRARGRLPILVGGTGLYLRALLKGQLTAAPGNAAVRARLRAEASRIGNAALHARLQAVDPASARAIGVNDLVRVVRALEVWEVTGQPPSAARPALWDPPRVAVSAFVVLTRERAELLRMIDARVRAMWDGGLLAEVRGLLAGGLSPEARPLQALGYRQAMAVLAGRMTEPEAVADMQRATRQYAKRQMTWFRREPAAEWIPVGGEDWAEPLAARILARCRGVAEAPPGGTMEGGRA